MARFYVVEGFYLFFSFSVPRANDKIFALIPIEPSCRLMNIAPWRQVKLLAEPWDCGGLYQVGSFPNWDVWGEWNGKFRDDIRQVTAH